MQDGVTMSISQMVGQDSGIMELVEKHETDHWLFRLMFRIKDLHSGEKFGYMKWKFLHFYPECHQIG